MRTLNRATMERTEEYIREYQQEYRQSPSYRQIMQGVGIASPSSVQRYVEALEREGRIRRRSGNIELPKYLKSGKGTVAPLVGSIACGQPNFAEERIEGSYVLPTEIFGGGKLYLLYAYGSSMVEAGIEEGDLLVIRQQSTAENGEIVVALTEEGEATLKRFYRRNGKIVLHPENKTMRDISVTTCDIQGVLVSCIKKY